MENIFIDTNIWHYSYVIPKEEKYKKIHEVAEDFILEKLSNSSVKIVISSYQSAEILEVLRKSGIETDKIKRLAEKFKTRKFDVIDISFADVLKAHSKSIVSNIHIYDYLAGYLLKGKVDKMYSADDHFLHDDFTGICEVINPLDPWILREGRAPKKDSP